MPPSLAERVAAREERFRRAHSAAAEAIVLPPAERRDFVAGHPDCLCPEFVELMIAMARERRGEEPRDSVRCAHLAVTAIEAYASAGGRDGDDVRALAWAELGNAHRICGDLRSAGMAFHFARERVRYAADPLVRAEVYSLVASYRDVQCEFGQAERLLRRAERLQRRFGLANGCAKVRMKRGMIAQRAGDLPTALAHLETALALIEPRENPGLAVHALHNLADCLIDAGCLDVALGILRRARPAYKAFAGPRVRAKRAWLEAKAVLRSGLGSLGEAMLEEVRNRFAELQCPYEAAVVTLDLTECYAASGRWMDVEEAAGQCLVLCQAHGVGKEGIAAAALLCEVASRRQGSVDAIASLAAVVRRHLAPKTFGEPLS